MTRSAAGGASALLATAVLLGGCGSGSEPEPATATTGEQRALADAAEMLDDRPSATPAAEPTTAAD